MYLFFVLSIISGFHFNKYLRNTHPKLAQQLGANYNIFSGLGLFAYLHSLKFMFLLEHKKYNDSKLSRLSNLRLIVHILGFICFGLWLYSKVWGVGILQE